MGSVGAKIDPTQAPQSDQPHPKVDSSHANSSNLSENVQKHVYASKSDRDLHDFLKQYNLLKFESTLMNECYSKSSLYIVFDENDKVEKENLFKLLKIENDVDMLQFEDAVREGCYPKRKIVKCDDKETIIYLWDGKIKGLGVSVGHIAMETAGSYISFWPIGGKKKAQLQFGTPGTFLETLDLDKGRSGDYSEKLKLYTLDTERIDRVFEDFKKKAYKKEILYSGLNQNNGMNCAAVVEQLIEVGGESPKFYDEPDMKDGGEYESISAHVSPIISAITWLWGAPDPKKVFQDLKERLESDSKKFEFVNKRGKKVDVSDFYVQK